MDRGLLNHGLDRGLGLKNLLHFSDTGVFLSPFLISCLLLLIGHSLGDTGIGLLLAFVFGLLTLFESDLEQDAGTSLLLSVWRVTVCPVLVDLNVTEAEQHSTKVVRDSLVEVDTSLGQVARHLMHIHNFLEGNLTVGVLENVPDSGRLISEECADLGSLLSADR